MAEQRLIDGGLLEAQCREIANIWQCKQNAPASWADAYEEFLIDVEECPTVPAVVLPCKVGDTVYEANQRGVISEYTVRCFKITSDAIFIEWELIDGIYSNVYGFLVSDKWGKTVFATREAAEAALAERMDAQEGADE